MAETITLGGGCFWCTEGVFKRVRGVVAVESGYCNGHVVQPTYEQVCSGDSGHVEVIQVTYDPAKVELDDLLRVFFATHDPTTMNRQGNDVGPQYRSGIYWTSESQRESAERIKAEAAGLWSAPIVTEVVQRENYSCAESYHQDYFDRNPNQGYCAVIIAPKISKFRKTFAHLLA